MFSQFFIYLLFILKITNLQQKQFNEELMNFLETEESTPRTVFL